jgi:hypothetical protein
MIPNPQLLGQHVPHMQTAQFKPPTYVQTPIPVAGTTGHHRPVQETPKNQNPPRPVSRPNTSLTASHVSSPSSVADKKPLLTKKESKDRSASLSKIPHDASSQASRTTRHSKHPKDDKPSKSSKDKDSQRRNLLKVKGTRKPPHNRTPVMGLLQIPLTVAIIRVAPHLMTPLPLLRDTPPPPRNPESPNNLRKPLRTVVTPCHPKLTRHYWLLHMLYNNSFQRKAILWKSSR